MLEERAEFEAALAIQPDYARAYAGLADNYIVLAVSNILPHGEAMAKAKMAARRALDLDPDLSEAHAALPSAKMR